ncbi:MAG: hypothetical protein EGQ18_02520 [Eubacterium ventriosum]|nr:hypothetical protein [Eubacterium ventriosum]
MKKTDNLRKNQFGCKNKKIITSTIAVVLVCSVTGSLVLVKTGKAGQAVKMKAPSATVTKGKINAFSDDGKSLRITVEF